MVQGDRPFDILAVSLSKKIIGPENNEKKAWHLKVRKNILALKDKIEILWPLRLRISGSVRGEKNVALPKEKFFSGPCQKRVAPIPPNIRWSAPKDTPWFV